MENIGLHPTKTVKRTNRLKCLLPFCFIYLLNLLKIKNIRICLICSLYLGGFSQEFNSVENSEHSIVNALHVLVKCYWKWEKKVLVHLCTAWCKGNPLTPPSPKCLTYLIYKVTYLTYEACTKNTRSFFKRS